nr:hypothetical protein [Actinospica robiniae]
MSDCMREGSAFLRRQQDAPGTIGAVYPLPRDSMAGYRGRGLPAGRKALITGGDSGIGRATAVGSAKEGADVAVAYSLAQALAKRGIRVNAVAPGPVWTPLIPSTLEPRRSSPPSAARSRRAEMAERRQASQASRKRAS